MKRFLIAFFGILGLLNLEIEISELLTMNFVEEAATKVIAFLCMVGTLLLLFVGSIILGCMKKISKFWILDIFLVVLYLVFVSMVLPILGVY